MLYDDPLSSEIVLKALRTSILGSRVDFFPTTTSTMDEARRAALDGAPEGTLALAEEQTQGRGRFQRTWVSPPGANLLFSLVLRPGLEASSQLSMMSSLALATALGRLVPTPSQVSIKWPNDVRVGGRKIGGILIEGSASAAEGSKGFAIVGMGVNVNFDPGDYPEIRDIATSLRRELGHPFPRLDLLTAVLEEMESLYVGITKGDSVRERWASLLDTVGRRIQVASGDAVYEGYAEGVDNDGSLLMRRDDGSVQVLAAGEVTLHL